MCEFALIKIFCLLLAKMLCSQCLKMVKYNVQTSCTVEIKVL